MRRFILLTLTCLLPLSSRAGDDKEPVPSKDSNVRVFVEVEIRGILQHADKGTTILARKQGFQEYQDATDPRKDDVGTHPLDFSRQPDLLALAKVLHGKEVVVTGKSELRLHIPPVGPMGGQTGFARGEMNWNRSTLYVHHQVLVTGLKSVEKK